MSVASHVVGISTLAFVGVHSPITAALTQSLVTLSEVNRPAIVAQWETSFACRQTQIRRQDGS